MKVLLNLEQKKSLSSFFNSLAVGWFLALFATPNIAESFNPLTLVIYLVNMIGALYISLFLLKEAKI